jgi:hypothetical protein
MSFFSFCRIRFPFFKSPLAFATYRSFNAFTSALHYLNFHYRFLIPLAFPFSTLDDHPIDCSFLFFKLRSF